VASTLAYYITYITLLHPYITSLYYSKNMTLKIVGQALEANPIKLFMAGIYGFFVIIWNACPWQAFPA
jgi:hypothetical protein